MELIKPIVRTGNSAQVILPKKWLGGTARVELIQKPLNIEEDILMALKPYMKETKGIYLTGSYARKEQTKNSDIDILVITENINSEIKKDRYNIILISEKILKRTLKRNILPLLPMIKESKPILNKALIERYKSIMPTKKNTKIILELAQSSRNICTEAINSAEQSKKLISDEVMYSLILGLRTIYIIECLKKNKNQTTKELKKLIEKLANKEAKESYEAYLRVKNNKKTKEIISIKTAKKINEYLIDKIKKLQR